MVRHLVSRFTAWAFVAVLLSGLASATASVTGQISATELGIPSGGEVDSTLLAVHLRDPLLSGLPEAEAVSFTLNAAQVRVDTYQYDPYLVTSAGSASAPMPVQPDMNQYMDARLESAPARPGYGFNVVAPDGGAAIHIASDCGALTPSGQQTFEAPAEVSHPATPVSVDVSKASQWTQCGPASVTVTGRFVVVVFGIDAVLTTSNETVELRSGDDQSSVSPLPPSGPAYITHRRQQYLYVDDGSLSFPMDRASDLAFLSGVQVQTAKELHFTNARGQLSQGAVVQPIQAASLTLDGDLQLSGIASTGQGGNLQATFAGQISRGDVDGKPLSFAVSPGQLSNSWGWIGFVGVGLVAASGAILVPLLRTRTRERHAFGHERARDLTNRANPEAGPLVSAWASAEPSDPEALECLATLLARRGELLPAWRHRQEAETILSQSSGLRWLRSENLLESAVLARRLSMLAVGRERKDWMLHAVRCLHGAVRLEPDLRHEADRHPDLRAIVADLDDADDWLTP